MKCTLTLVALGIGTSLGIPGGRHSPILKWEPPGEDDDRGPCPMLNTLANHNLIPHDGKILTEETVVDALFKALHFDHEFGAFLFGFGLQVNREPNATWFTLDQLNQHNLIEHDASLSRLDAYFGNNHIFNQAIFDKTRAYWTAPVLNPEMMANGKLARQIESRAYNPTYTFPSTTNEASLLEIAAPIVAFGDPESGTVQRKFVEYFFEKERLPAELGWVPREEALTKDDMMRVSHMIRNATDLLTPSDAFRQRARGEILGYT